MGALIGGGSSAIVSSFTAIALTPEAYNLRHDVTPTMKLFGVCFIVNGITSLCLWLKQRPVPDIETD